MDFTADVGRAVWPHCVGQATVPLRRTQPTPIGVCRDTHALQDYERGPVGIDYEQQITKSIKLVGRLSLLVPDTRDSFTHDTTSCQRSCE